MELIDKYFPNLTDHQRMQFSKMYDVYSEWNEKINVISRKDIDNIYLHHVLHSLAIAKVIKFKPGTKVIDVGTGGGFPGVPLAVMYPETEFYMVDAIGKKIKVVNVAIEALGLKNAKAEHKRIQQVKDQFDFVVSRAVTAFPKFEAMVRKNILKKSTNELKNGIIYIKGGDFYNEIELIEDRVKIFDCTNYFEEDFFETKKVIHCWLK